MRTKVSNNDFNGQSFYIGIDCHKKSWNVTILGQNYVLKNMSQNPDPEVLSNYLKRNYPGGNYYAVYEAGFSGFDACRKLNELGVNCNVIHAADVPTTLKEKLQKSDKVDSKKLARSLRSQELDPIDIPERSLEADRSLVRQRNKIAKDISRTKNRVKSLLFQFGIDIPDNFSSPQTRHWSKVYINWLKELKLDHLSLRQTLDNYLHIGELLRKELLLLNRQVRTLSQTEAYKTNTKLLMSIPGIGIISSMTILTQIGDINRFNRLDDLCNYIGLVPRMHGSGEKVNAGRLLKRGHKGLKIILIEASWVAIRKDPALMLKFNELSKRMNKNKAIIRIAKKLISRIRHILIHQIEYECSVIE